MYDQLYGIKKDETYLLLIEKLKPIFKEEKRNYKKKKFDINLYALEQARSYLAIFNNSMIFMPYYNLHEAGILIHDYYVKNKALKEYALRYNHIDKDIYILMNAYYSSTLNQVCKDNNINLAFKGFDDIETIFKFNNLDLELFNQMREQALYDIETIEFFEVFLATNKVKVNIYDSLKGLDFS